MVAIEDTTSAVKTVGKAGRAKAAKQDSPEDLKKACRQFEEIFLRMVLKEAHLDRSLGNESDRAGIYGDVVVESLAKSVAGGGGLGIADMLYRQLTPKLAVTADSSTTTPKLNNRSNDHDDTSSP